MNYPSKLSLLAGLAALCLSAENSQALQFHQDITAYFGSGNPSTEWVTDTTSDGITLALRGRERYTTNMPNENGVFSFDVGKDVNIDFSVSGEAIGGYNFRFTVVNSYGLPSPFSFSIYDFTDNATVKVDGIRYLQNSQRLPFTAIPGTYDISLAAYAVGDTSYANALATTNISVNIGSVPSVPDGGATIALLGMVVAGLGVAKRKLAAAR